jgi:hypothetical protein
MKQSVKRILTAIQEKVVSEVNNRVAINYGVEDAKEEYISVSIWADNPYKAVVFDFRMNDEELEWNYSPADYENLDWHDFDYNQMSFGLILFSQIF